jgi:hypothetical protein
MFKYLPRILLFAVLVFSITIFVAAINILGVSNVSTWATLVAVLAVLASVISAWSSFENVVLQKEALKPDLELSFDFRSRYSLIQLSLANKGGSAAKNIKIEWDNNIVNNKDEVVTFNSSSGDYDILKLSQGEEILKKVDVHFSFFEKNDPVVFTGVLKYSDLSGKDYEQPFRLSAEHYKGTLVYDREEIKTHYEMQKLPKLFKKIIRELKQLNRKLDSFQEDEQT